MNQDAKPNPDPPATPDPPTPQPPQAPATPRAKTATRTRQPAPDETVKETIESIIIAFILAFVFRAFVVEPFIIPTGSMAPTMLGAHLQLSCESCGYQFDMGVSPNDDDDFTADGILERPKTALCPMCNYEIVVSAGTRVSSGDRILVDKFSYHIVTPSRWDVVVFKAPKGQDINGEPAPRTNFIKRLIGLPGERICILDGNIFIAPAGTSDFVIARKTDPLANSQWQLIQRSVWQPIYYSQYVPIEDGTPQGPGRDERHAWRIPWQVQQGSWEMGSVRNPSRVYRFVGGSDAGEIRFDMVGGFGTSRYDGQDNRFPYNQLSNAQRDGSAIEDIRLACAMTPLTADATLHLSTTARLDRPDLGIETLRASVSVDGTVELSAISGDGASRTLGQAIQIDPLEQGIAVEVELWLVDDEASVWINGERVIVQRFDLTWEQLAARPAQQQLPDIRISIDSEGPVELRRVELDRDISYFAGQNHSSVIARAEARRIDGELVIGPTPLELREETGEHDAEFFVLGDNQPASEDGRDWPNVDGWVQERYFDGEARAGIVPESLFVGRAFMVYYPAPHGVSPYAKGIFPDFGRMRFVH